MTSQQSSVGLTNAERRIVYLVSVIQFVNILDFMMVMPMGPDFALALGIPTDRIGYVGGAYTAAAFFSAFAGALYLDRLDRRTGLAIANDRSCAFDRAGRSGDGFAQPYFRPAAGRVIRWSRVVVIARHHRRQRSAGTAWPRDGDGRCLVFRRRRVRGSDRAGTGEAGRLAHALFYHCSTWLAGSVRRHPHHEAATQPYGGPPSFRTTHSDRNAWRPVQTQHNQACSIGDNAGSVRQFFADTQPVDLFPVQPRLSEARICRGCMPVAGSCRFFSMRYAGRLVDRFGGFKVITGLSTVLIAVYYTLFLHYNPVLPVLLLFTIFMTINGARFVVINATNTKVPPPQQRAAFMSLVAMAQHLGSSTAAFTASLLLVARSDQSLGPYTGGGMAIGWRSAPGTGVDLSPGKNFVGSALSERSDSDAIHACRPIEEIVS